MAILKEVMTNEASVLLDTDAANKALDADQALQELGSDAVAQAYVTATVTVWDDDPIAAQDRLALVEKTVQGQDFTCMRETINAVEAWLGSLPRVWGFGWGACRSMSTPLSGSRRSRP